MELRSTGMATPSSDFSFIAGDLSLDFVNTVDWRLDGQVTESLADYAGLVAWAEAAGVVEDRVGRRLRALAEREPENATMALGSAIRLRAVIHAAASGIAPDRSANDARADENDVDLSSVAALNDHLHRAMRQIRLAPPTTDHDSPLLLTWSEMGERLDCIEWPVVWAAARLLASDDASNIRVCAAPDCGWMYVDRSRNGLRRWCQMETCGARAKSRRRYARVKQARESESGG